MGALPMHQKLDLDHLEREADAQREKLPLTIEGWLWRWRDASPSGRAPIGEHSMRRAIQAGETIALTQPPGAVGRCGAPCKMPLHRPAESQEERNVMSRSPSRRWLVARRSTSGGIVALK